MKFEEQNTPEARFAKAMDNIQPNLLNNATEGRMWVKNNIKLSQVLKRNQPTQNGSDKLWDYQYNYLIKPNVDSNKIIDDMD